MPANVERVRVRPKREFKRGFWWTLGTVAAYALVAAGVLAVARYAKGLEPAGALSLQAQEASCAQDAYA